MSAKFSVLYLFIIVIAKNTKPVLTTATIYSLSKADAKLVIAGTGPEREYFESVVAKYGLKDRVIFLGNVSREDMPKYLSLCDVFVLPSYFDTTPNVLLEAMACGCPCVVSDIDGVREVVEGGCGLLVKVGDPGDLAVKVSDVLLKPVLSKKLSQRARRRAVGRYSWKRAIGNYVKLYESYPDA